MNLKMLINNALLITFNCSKKLFFEISRKSKIAFWCGRGIKPGSDWHENCNVFVRISRF